MDESGVWHSHWRTVLGFDLVLVVLMFPQVDGGGCSTRVWYGLAALYPRDVRIARKQAATGKRSQPPPRMDSDLPFQWLVEGTRPKR